MPFNQSVSGVSLSGLLRLGSLAGVLLVTAVDLVVVRFPVLVGSLHGTVSNPSSIRA